MDPSELNIPNPASSEAASSNAEVKSESDDFASVEIPAEIKDKFFRKKLYYIRIWVLAYLIIAIFQYTFTTITIPDDRPFIVHILYNVYNTAFLTLTILSYCKDITYVKPAVILL